MNTGFRFQPSSLLLSVVRRSMFSVRRSTFSVSGFRFQPSSLIFFLFLAACLGFVRPSFGLMEAMDTGDLVREAEAVVVGRVTDVKAYWTADGKKIITRISVDVETVVYGLADTSRVLVEVEGGWLGDIGLKVSDTPSFAQGEHVLLFLRPAAATSLQGAAPATAVFAVAGLAQGKYTVTPDNTTVKTGFAVIGDLNRIDNQLPLEEMMERVIEEAAAAGKLNP
ncbi:MAG: hypothetical protein HY343_05130 [Lentisphaerae bacterium]|nr:hypothetical protein [Lentisphaerota bacterium]